MLNHRSKSVNTYPIVPEVFAISACIFCRVFLSLTTKVFIFQRAWSDPPKWHESIIFLRNRKYYHLYAFIRVEYGLIQCLCPLQNTPKPVGSPSRPPAPDTLPLLVLIKALEDFRPTIPSGTEVSKLIDAGLITLKGIKNDVIDSPLMKITVDPMRVSTRELRASVQPMAASGELLPSVADKFEALGHLSNSMMGYQMFFSPAFINIAKQSVPFPVLFLSSRACLIRTMFPV